MWRLTKSILVYLPSVVECFWHINRLTIIERLRDEKNIHFSKVNLCKEAADIIADTMRENARYRKVLEMLSKRQIATWYPKTQLQGDKGYYAGWDDAEYAVKQALSNKDSADV